MWYKNQTTVTRVLTCYSYDETMSKSDCRLQYRKTECYWINWKGLDGSGRGLIILLRRTTHTLHLKKLDSIS